jgi:hypothetical protein
LRIGEIGRDSDLASPCEGVWAITRYRYRVIGDAKIPVSLPCCRIVMPGYEIGRAHRLCYGPQPEYVAGHNKLGN